jgi:hypothetical protein
LPPLPGPKSTAIARSKGLVPVANPHTRLPRRPSVQSLRDAYDTNPA